MAEPKPFNDVTNKDFLQANQDAVSKTGLGQDFFGDMRLGSKAGGGSVKVEGTQNRIIINDGTNDRILIGYQKDGF